MNWTKNFFLGIRKTRDPLCGAPLKNPIEFGFPKSFLQQTRTAQGLPYYKNFIANFPSISDLALAKEDEVLKLWQGLGYYSRARNLHATLKVYSF